MRRRELLGSVVGAVWLGGATPASARGGTAPEPYEPAGRVEVEGTAEAVLGEDGTTAYLATGDGFATVDVSDPAAMSVLAERRGLLADRDDGPLEGVLDVSVDGDRLLVAGPANPRRGDPVEGFLLYDVADPADPRRVAFYETDHPVHNAYLDDGVAYLTAGSVLDVVDVSGDDPTRVATWEPAEHDLAWADVTRYVRPLHDVWVQNGLAYLAFWDAGTFVVDVEDPGEPSFVARVGGRPLDELRAVPEDDPAEINGAILQPPGNHHYVQPSADGDLLAVGKEAWEYAESEEPGGPAGIELWDVADLQAPTLLAEVEPPRADDERRVGGTWTTAHNFDLVGDCLYSSWYQGGVKLHDVSDPRSPEELAWWRRQGEAAFWTARRTAGEHFVASSTAADGLPGDLYEGLYAFPDRAGEQPDRPGLTPSPTTTPTRSPTSTTDPPTTTPAGTPSPTATTGDGLGAVAGLGGLTAAAWWYGRE